jgi:hypothetical protein
MKFLALAGALLLAPLAQASGTKTLTSTSGHQITLNYSTSVEVTNSNKPARITTADSIQIGVTHPSLKISDRVRVVLVNKATTQLGCGANQVHKKEETHMLDLGPAGAGPFLGGELTSPLLISNLGYCYTVYGKLEVAVVVNGEWLQDPINGSHNFQVDLAQP